MTGLLRTEGIFSPAGAVAPAARGFGAEGVGASDRVTSPGAITISAGDDLSWHFWLFLPQAQQDAFPAIFEIGTNRRLRIQIGTTTGSADEFRLRYTSDATEYESEYSPPSFDTWVSVYAEFDGATKTWLLEYDNVEQTPAVVGGSGTETPPAADSSIYWGNDAAQGDITDCRLSECALWRRKLTSQERLDLAAGTILPRELSTDRISYIPMNGTGQDEDLGSLTITGTVLLAAPPAIAS